MISSKGLAFTLLGELRSLFHVLDGEAKGDGIPPLKARSGVTGPLLSQKGSIC